MSLLTPHPLRRLDISSLLLFLLVVLCVNFQAGSAQRESSLFQHFTLTGVTDSNECAGILLSQTQYVVKESVEITPTRVAFELKVTALGQIRHLKLGRACEAYDIEVRVLAPPSGRSTWSDYSFDSVESCREALRELHTQFDDVRLSDVENHCLFEGYSHIGISILFDHDARPRWRTTWPEHAKPRIVGLRAGPA